MSNKSLHLRPNLTLNFAIVSLLLIFAIGPIVILIFNSLKSPVDFGLNPLGFPRHLVWSNFPRAWLEGNFSVTVPNTLILVVGTVLGVLVLGGMAAYAISRLHLPGGSGLTMYFLVSSSLPIQLFLVPLFFLWHSVGLANNIFGLIIIYIAVNSPFSIFLMRAYMVQIPDEFEDAARMDGAGPFQIFFRIIVPIARPALLTVGLVVGLAVWNEYLLATVFLSDPSHYTIVTSYYNFQTQFSRDWGLTSAAAIMMIAPLLALFLSLQRRFVEGLTQGGIKG